MNEPENLSNIAGTIFTAMNTRDFDLFEKITTDDVEFDFPGVGRVEGRRRTMLVFRSILRKYTELQFTVTDIITQGNCACAVWTNRGESSDGTPYSNSGMTLVRFNGEKISFISDYFKDTSFVDRS